jgi:hypothetical protein
VTRARTRARSRICTATRARARVFPRIVPSVVGFSHFSPFLLIDLRV